MERADQDIKTIIADYQVITLDIGKQNINWIKEKPMFVISTPPSRHVAAPTAVIGDPL